jgi:hypothetical protein
MLNSTLKPSAKPMKRSPMARGTSQLKRSWIKAGRRKTSKIRQSARGQECLINLPGGWHHDPETVVLCHKPSGGKGMKSPDSEAAYGCYWCHMVVDGQHQRPEGITLDQVQENFDRACAETKNILNKQGLL